MSSRTVVKYGFETQVNTGKGCASSNGARTEPQGALIIKGMQNRMNAYNKKQRLYGSYYFNLNNYPVKHVQTLSTA